MIRIILLFIFLSAFYSQNCDYNNPVYLSILSYDVNKNPNELKNIQRQFVQINENEEISEANKFYLDSVKNSCFFEFVGVLNLSNPRIYIYSIYSSYEQYSQKKPHEGFILSIRGTKVINDALPDLQILFGSLPYYYTEAFMKIDEFNINNRSLNLVQNIKFFVGHSLGGILSHLLGIHYNKENYSIDSPGSLNLIAELRKEENNISLSQIEEVKKKTLSFRSLPNIVNQFGEHFTDESFIIYNDYLLDCKQFFHTTYNILNLKFTRTIKSLGNLELTLRWNAYNHKLLNIRNSILTNFQDDGYEIIGKFKKEEINLKHILQGKKSNIFWNKLYKCYTEVESNTTSLEELKKEAFEKFDNPEDIEIN